MSDHPDKLREYRIKIIPAQDAPPPAKYPDHLGYRTKFGGGNKATMKSLCASSSALHLDPIFHREVRQSGKILI